MPQSLTQPFLNGSFSKRQGSVSIKNTEQVSQAKG